MKLVKWEELPSEMRTESVRYATKQEGGKIKLQHLLEDLIGLTSMQTAMKFCLLSFHLKENKD